MEQDVALERPPLEMIAFAAWVNVPVDQIPASFRAPTCKATMEAWKRVADALRAAMLDDMREPREVFLAIQNWNDDISGDEVIGVFATEVAAQNCLSAVLKAHKKHGRDWLCLDLRVDKTPILTAYQEKHHGGR